MSATEASSVTRQ